MQKLGKRFSHLSLACRYSLRSSLKNSPSSVTEFLSNCHNLCLVVPVLKCTRTYDRGVDAASFGWCKAEEASFRLSEPLSTQMFVFLDGLFDVDSSGSGSSGGSSSE